MKINPLRLGVVVGVLVGLWHVAWCALVAAGAAQPLLDFVLQLHFIQASLTVAPFSMRTATSLVAIAFIYGFALGALVAVAWNWLCGRNPYEIEDKARLSSFL